MASNFPIALTITDLCNASKRFNYFLNVPELQHLGVHSPMQSRKKVDSALTEILK